jgi:hypothetical protein
MLEPVRSQRRELSGVPEVHLLLQLCVPYAVARTRKPTRQGIPPMGVSRRRWLRASPMSWHGSSVGGG